VAGTIERVSVDSGGAEGDANSNRSSLSADGRYVAFASNATNLVAGDTNGVDDIFLRDRALGTTERISVDSNEGEALTHSLLPAISSDGRFVAFRSDALNLVAGDTNGFDDIFVRDRLTGATERVSVESTGAQANSYSFSASISADGRYVAIWSLASNLVTGDSNGAADIFVRDRGTAQPAVYCTAGTTSHGCNASIASDANPSVSLANACNITVINVEGAKSGIVFYGIDNAGDPPSPWGVGGASWLCVKAPTQRTPLQNSGGTFGACDGSFALDWNAFQSSHPLALGNPWSAGAKVYVQAWFRDPLAVKSTNLSNALELTYVP